LRLFWWVRRSGETFDILFYALVGNLEHTVSVLLQHVIMLPSEIMAENNWDESQRNLKLMVGSFCYNSRDSPADGHATQKRLFFSKTYIFLIQTFLGHKKRIF